MSQTPPHTDGTTDPTSGPADRAEARLPDPRLLEILVCPVTRGPLTLDRDACELISRAAGLAYPIREGVPIMLPEEARTLDEADRS